MKFRLKPFAICLAIPLLTGGLAAWITSDAMQTFGTLHQPPLSPPGWLFPVVWTLLYMVMGLGCYLVWQARPEPEHKKRTLIWYGVQLLLNFLWPLIFFGLSWHLPAFFLLLGLLAASLYMTVQFFRLHKAAGLIQIPYLLWLAFAAYLNLGIYFLN